MATYIRLTDYKDSDSKEQGFFKSENRYEAKQDDFEKIPGSPIAYWVSNQTIQNFEKTPISESSDTREGMATADNNKFTRLWYEIDNHNFFIDAVTRELAQDSGKKWFPYASGGEYRRWFGNHDLIVNWGNDGFEIRNFKNEQGKVRSHNYNLDLIFQEGLTWTSLSSNNFAIRLMPKGFLFSGAGTSLFTSKENLMYILGFLNMSIPYNYLTILNPTLNFTPGNVGKLPIIFPKKDLIKEQIETLTQQNVSISEEEWDSRETSWDFTKNELLKHKSDLKLETAYNNYCSYWKEKFYKLHANEEELNRLFIDIYELGDELTPDVDLKDITILKSESIINDRGELEFKADEIMKQFISYAVGVMFGRYSLDKDGLQIANLGSEILISQMTDETKVSFPIDDDNVIPVLEDDYFSDDIASRVINFVKTTFGSESLSKISTL